MKITLLEVIRGADAWKRLLAANSANPAPASDADYCLARIRFEYFARGTPGTCVHVLRPNQFTAYSADGVEYEHPQVTVPNPVLAGSLKAGESREGWVAFLIPKRDTKPLMNYSADIGAGTLHGGSGWFQLR